MKVVILINDDWSVLGLRKNLITALVDRGADVTVVSPDGPYVPKIIELGVKHVVVPMYRFASPLRDLKLCFDIFRVLRSEKPDIVHAMTIKPNTYGAMAAWVAGVPKTVTLLCGLGFTFSKEEGGWKEMARRVVASSLYWLASKVTHSMWFANPDDLSLFVKKGFVTKERALLTMGEGVNVEKFSPENVNPEDLAKLRAEFGIDKSTQVVLMLVARLVWNKGVRQFVETSELVARCGKPVKFILVGPFEPESPHAVPESYIQSKTSPEFIHIGFRSDVKELISLADIIALPSWYREGCPLALIEGLAMAKPIVTCDSVGCRQVVDEGKNGFLVPTQDTAAFASAVEKLISDSALRDSFGCHSRMKAVTEFEDSIIMKQVMTELYGLDN